MNIKLKHSDSRWVKIEDAEFKIDYPTKDQQDEIDELQDTLIYYQTGSFKPIEGDTEEESNKRFLDYINNLSPEVRAKVKSITKKICRLYIKYSIKGWKNINDSDGNEVEFRLTNNEMEDNLFNKFTDNMRWLQLLTFFNMIKPEVEFTDTDKKKFSSDSIAEEVKS